MCTVRRNHWMPLIALALAAGALAGCGDDGGEEPGGAAQNTTTTAAPAPVVAADMVAADGSPAGRVTFVEAGGRLTVEAKLTNLPPGFHGFHIHAVGKCERGTPPFTSAGGHLAVGGQAHPDHAGDQPVLLVLADRTAELRFTTDRYKLSDLQTAEGRAVIVHANPDNYGNVPTRYARQPDATTTSTGDAGDRIACGVVGGGGGTGGGTSSTAVAATLDCRTVAFTPNSEDAASSIKATGLPCAEAEAFVRVAGARTSSGGPAQLDVEGYRCVRVRTSQDPIPQAFYECTSGTKKVTFVRT